MFVRVICECGVEGYVRGDVQSCICCGEPVSEAGDSHE